MRATINLFPNEKCMDELKVFYEQTLPIKGIAFTRDRLKEAEAVENSDTPAVYVLLNRDTKEVYIGQSISGIGRIHAHVREKDFWTECILFVSDMDYFGKNGIDYLEQVFIQKFRQGGYHLMNRDFRPQKPKAAKHEEYLFETYASHIEFLLKGEKVSLKNQEEKFNIFYLSSEVV